MNFLRTKLSISYITWQCLVFYHIFSHIRLSSAYNSHSFSSQNSSRNVDELFSIHCISFTYVIFIISKWIRSLWENSLILHQTNTTVTKDRKKKVCIYIIFSRKFSIHKSAARFVHGCGKRPRDKIKNKIEKKNLHKSIMKINRNKNEINNSLWCESREREIVKSEREKLDAHIKCA